MKNITDIVVKLENVISLKIPITHFSVVMFDEISKNIAVFNRWSSKDMPKTSEQNYAKNVVLTLKKEADILLDDRCRYDYHKSVFSLLNDVLEIISFELVYDDGSTVEIFVDFQEEAYTNNGVKNSKNKYQHNQFTDEGELKIVISKNHELF